jgi:Skp family chaperone for outer membrane proteins
MLKKSLLLLFFISFVCALPLYSESFVNIIKIGFVDVEDVFNSYPGTAEIRQKLKDERDKFQVEIDKQKENIGRLEKDFQLNIDRLSDEEKQRRGAEVEYKKELLNDYIEDSNKKLNGLKDELTKPIYLKIADVIRKVSSEKSYSFVFRKGSESLLYVKNSFDITPDVKTRLQKELSIEERN